MSDKKKRRLWRSLMMIGIAFVFILTSVAIVQAANQAIDYGNIVTMYASQMSDVDPDPDFIDPRDYGHLGTDSGVY